MVEMKIMIKTKLPFLVLTVLLLAPLASLTAPAQAGFAGDFPAIAIKNSTGMLPSDHPFYWTTMVGTLTILQGDPTNYIWIEQHNIVAHPEPDFNKYQITLQNEIDPNIGLYFSFKADMIGQSGVKDGDTIAVGGDPPPLIFDPPPFTYVPPPVEIPLPPEIVFFDLWGYRSSPIKVGEGLFFIGILADVDIDPDTLNLASNGQYVTAYVTLPIEYDINDVNFDSIRLNRGIPSIPIGSIGEDCLGFNCGKFSFARGIVADIYETTDVDGETGKFREETVTISGTLLDGTAFAGVDSIKIIDKG